VVTTIRLEQKHWRWLREEALRRALESGGKTDASVIVRELVDRAMSRAKQTDLVLSRRMRHSIGG
jgi:predicted DNA-binding ribbon-helix-helix protein